MKTSWSVKQLEEQIANHLNIPVETLIICLRYEQASGYNKPARCDLFNMEWRKDKIVGDVSKIAHGWTLYVEEWPVENGKPNFEKLHWKQEIDLEMDKITFQFSFGGAMGDSMG